MFLHNFHLYFFHCKWMYTTSNVSVMLTMYLWYLGTTLLCKQHTCINDIYNNVFFVTYVCDQCGLEENWEREGSS